MFSLLDRQVDLLRRTAEVLEATTALAAHSLTRQPAATALLEVTLSGGQAATGTVTATGLLGGAAVSGVLTFAGAGTKTTEQPFDSVNASGITTSGLADEVPAPTISIRALSRDRQPVHAEVSLVTGWPARLTEKAGRLPGGEAGTAQARETAWYLPYATSFTPREEDVVRDTSDGNARWRVRAVSAKPSPLQPSHWELLCGRDEGTP